MVFDGSIDPDADPLAGAVDRHPAHLELTFSFITRLYSLTPAWLVLESRPVNKLTFSIILSAVFSTSLVAADKKYKAIFDGKTLEGWTQRNGTATYRVEKKAVVGKTNEGSPNSFLCTDKEYANFDLVFEVKVDDRLNSGVQIRSQTKGGPKGRVNGPQVEIEASGKTAPRPATFMAKRPAGG